jgi:hypothetical protein
MNPECLSSDVLGSRWFAGPHPSEDVPAASAGDTVSGRGTNINARTTAITAVGGDAMGTKKREETMKRFPESHHGPRSRGCTSLIHHGEGRRDDDARRGEERVDVRLELAP